jgi:hypothetical protein
MEAAEIPVKSSKGRICLQNIEKAGVMEVECAGDGAGKSSFELICWRIILTYSLADGARLDVTPGLWKRRLRFRPHQKDVIPWKSGAFSAA